MSNQKPPMKKKAEKGANCASGSATALRIR